MVSRRAVQRAFRTGFTLMEMLVVVAIIVALAGIGGFFLMGQLSQGQRDAAQTQVKGPLTQACQAYWMNNGSQYPDSLQQLLQRDQHGKGPYLESEDALRDPWGQLYQYDKSGPKNQGMKPDIWTVPPAGANQNPQENMIGNWPKGR